MTGRRTIRIFAVGICLAFVAGHLLRHVDSTWTYPIAAFIVAWLWLVSAAVKERPSPSTPVPPQIGTKAWAEMLYAQGMISLQEKLEYQSTCKE